MSAPGKSGHPSFLKLHEGYELRQPSTTAAKIKLPSSKSDFGGKARANLQPNLLPLVEHRAYCRLHCGGRCIALETNEGEPLS